MSARRIISRNRWRNGKYAGMPYHTAAVASGERHTSFMARKRKARVAVGLSLTSSNMHSLHGARI